MNVPCSLGVLRLEHVRHCPEAPPHRPSVGGGGEVDVEAAAGRDVPAAAAAAAAVVVVVSVVVPSAAGVVGGRGAPLSVVLLLLLRALPAIEDSGYKW